MAASLILLAVAIGQGAVSVSPQANTPAAGEQIKWQVIASGGLLNSASASYVMHGTVGQTAVGWAQSASYGLNSGFWQGTGTGGGSCCVGRVGNANGEGGDDPTIGDISLMIDALFITASVTPLITPPACIDEADVNLSAVSAGHWPPIYEDITIGDVSALIDALFITADLSILLSCP